MSARRNEMARDLVDKKREHYRKKKEAEIAERAYRAAEHEFWDYMDESGDKTSVIDLGEGYGEIQLQKRETHTGTILNHDEAVKSLTARGLQDAILGPASVRKKVLNEHIRDWKESGEPLPEGIDIYTRKYITVTERNK